MFGRNQKLGAVKKFMDGNRKGKPKKHWEQIKNTPDDNDEWIEIKRHGGYRDMTNLKTTESVIPPSNILPRRKEHRKRMEGRMIRRCNLLAYR